MQKYHYHVVFRATNDQGVVSIRSTTINAAEPSPRELEVLGIFDVIKSVGALDKAVYSTFSCRRTLL